MATITSAGIGSGLDINSLVTQLVEAEAEAPTARLDRRQSDLQLRLSAYGQMKSALSSLSSSLGNLKNFSTFRAYSTTSSDSDIFTATSSGKISKAGYDVNVTGLAENHKLPTDPTLAGAPFTDITDTLSTGRIPLTLGTPRYAAGTYPYTGLVASTETAAATLPTPHRSQHRVGAALHAPDTRRPASLIYDGSHYRLAVSSDDTGADNSPQISVSDDDGNNDDAAGLSLLAFNDTATHLEQNAAASDASLTLNGIAISSSSNTVTEAIDGVSINLKSVGSATLNTTTDKAKVKSAVTQFVASYNAFFGAVNQLTAYNPETRVAGELNGDGVTRSITSNIQRIIGNPVGTLGDDFTILAEAGITTDPNNGRLVINDATLDKQLDQNFDKFISLFTAFGETADTHTEFVSSTDDTVVGNYAVNITSLATRGELVGSAAANLTIVEGSNDALTLNIDGVTASVTLAAGSYTVAELATELKSKVNALSEFSNAGIRIDVSSSGGVLSLLSQSYGSSSKVEITAGNGKTDLVGGAATSTDGMDVAGNIGGVAATGNGRLLTGAGDAAGLVVEITGGSVGERGAIDFKRGYAEQLDSYLGSLLASDGFFKSTTASLENRLETIADERETLGRGLLASETRLRGGIGAVEALTA